MSHADYVARCDEDQLDALIEHAKARQQQLRQAGWVKLWTVSLGWGNSGWFAENNFDAAVAHASAALQAAVAQRGAHHIELEIKLERYRPAEVAGLLAKGGA
jgi:hypothetical protein